jgi:hypothetical protein
VLEPVPLPTSRAPEDHLGDVVKALLGGRLVTVVGAGVNVTVTNGAGLPGPAEVISHLVKSFDCPPEYARDLAHVAEYVTLTNGVGPLYDELHALYAHDFAPRPVDRALARIAGLLRAHGEPHQLIVTTNFDESLEQPSTRRERSATCQVRRLGPEPWQVPAPGGGWRGDGGRCRTRMPTSPSSRTVISRSTGHRQRPTEWRASS